MSHMKLSRAFTKRELATVLAALRYWQKFVERHRSLPIEEHFDPKFDAHGRFTIHAIQPLSLHEIDTLCERLNSTG